MASTYSATNLEEMYASGVRNFENEDFSNKDLRGLSIVDITFVNCDFENSAIDHSILNGCKFIYCNFKFTRFDEADLSDCLIEECDFESTSFVCTNLIGTQLVGVNTNEADFRGALFEERCYVDTYGGIPVSGQISTKQEYLEAIEVTPDFCGKWREFASREEAQNFIDKHNGVDEYDGRIDITPDMFPIAFQSWQNGGIQTSSIYPSNRFYDNGESEFDAFVSKHENSNTFATLHICNNIKEWIATNIQLFG